MVKHKISRKLIWPHIGGFFLLLFLFSVGYFSLKTVYRSQKMITEEMKELHLVTHLKLAIMKAVMPTHNYLVMGLDPKEEANFSLLAKQADLLFNQLGALKFDREEELRRFNLAKDKFNQVKALAQQIFSLKLPYGNPDAGALMEEMDALTESALLDLDKFEAVALDEHSEALEKVDFISKQSLNIFIGAVVVALLGLFFLAIFIPRLISRPIITLHQSAELIGKGNFSQRIHLRTGDELEGLADEFNRMTEHLQLSYAQLEEKVKERTSDLQKVNQELKETQARLTQSAKMAAIGQLAGGVAHEINNPLIGVLNNVQLIKSEVEQKRVFSLGEFKEVLDIIENSALRCKRITQSLLDFSRTGKRPYQPTNINEVLESTFILVERDIIIKHIKLSKELTANLPLVKVDSNQLQQVFLDIIDNARWALKDKKETELKIKTEASLDEKSVMVIFSDNGCGIPPENLSHIFEPFFTTKKPGEGVGLGLSICYGIIKEHGGNIEIESEGRDRGASFKITLPAIS